MQWVEKGNEECPYCRKDMISPNEFYQTAVEVVGLARVEKLKRINQEAAARIASLRAAGQVNISHPVPPTGRRPVEAIEMTTNPADAPPETRQTPTPLSSRGE